MSVRIRKESKLNLGPSIDKALRHPSSRLRLLIKKLKRGGSTAIELDDLKMLIESISPENSDYGLAVDRIQKVRRYLLSDEIGAANYELNLLLGGLLQFASNTGRSPHE